MRDQLLRNIESLPVAVTAQAVPVYFLSIDYLAHGEREKKGSARRSISHTCTCCLKPTTTWIGEPGRSYSTRTRYCDRTMHCARMHNWQRWLCIIAGIDRPACFACPLLTCYFLACLCLVHFYYIWLSAITRAANLAKSYDGQHLHILHIFFSRSYTCMFYIKIWESFL
jgi:hypothetical protein